MPAKRGKAVTQDCPQGDINGHGAIDYRMSVETLTCLGDYSVPRPVLRLVCALSFLLHYPGSSNSAVRAHLSFDHENQYECNAYTIIVDPTSDTASSQGRLCRYRSLGDDGSSHTSSPVLARAPKRVNRQSISSNPRVLKTSVARPKKDLGQELSRVLASFRPQNTDLF